MNKVMTQVQIATKGVRRHFKVHGPAYMTAAGVVGAVVTAKLAYDAGKQIQKYVTDHEDAVERGEEVDQKQLRTRVIKAVVVPAAVGVASAGLIFGGYKIMAGRVAALGAALAVTKKENERFRKYIREHHPDVMMAPVKNPTEVLAGPEEAGKEDPETVTAYDSDYESYLDGVWFNQSRQYQSDQEGMAYNVTFIESVARKLSNKQASKGYITMLDVYRALEIDGIGRRQAQAMSMLGFPEGTYFDFEQTIVRIKEDGGYSREVPYVSWPTPVSIVSYVMADDDSHEYAY